MKKICVGCTAMCIALLSCINFIMDYSCRLFLYDLLSFFSDNRSYLIHIFIPAVVFSMITVIFVHWILRRKMIFYFTIRIVKRVWEIDVYQMVKKVAGKIYILLCIFCVSVFVCNIFTFFRDYKAQGWAGDITIAHAGGRYDNNDYLNCLEAIEYNYLLGHRTFEIDFSVTKDNKLVCKHDWDYTMQEGNESGEVWDEATFLSVKLFGKYTPISFADLCKLMEKYPDIWLVTDTKDADEELVIRDFEIMVSTVKELNLERVLDRMAVQIYNEEMYHTVSKIYPFKSWIYTLYQFWGGDEATFLECVRFCANHNIKNITTWNYMMNSELVQLAQDYGIKVFVHTEDDIENARKLKNIGVTGFYTNILTPDMFVEE